jgi:acyl-CoA thioester hydrolase
MNVMWYVGKFDEATWTFFAQCGLTPGYMRQEQRGMAAVQQNITYKREFLAGDIVEIHSRMLEVRDKAVRFVHEMHHAEAGEVAAICDLTGVHLDRTSRKAVSFSGEIRSSMMSILERARR